MTASEATRAFLDRYEEAMIGWPEVPAGWSHFRAMIEQRVAEGEAIYGDDWRERDNLVEAFPEGADAIAYTAFHIAQTGTENIDLALTAAEHFRRGVEVLERLAHKDRGEP